MGFATSVGNSHASCEDFGEGLMRIAVAPTPLEADDKAKDVVDENRP